MPWAKALSYGCSEILTDAKYRRLVSDGIVKLKVGRTKIGRE